MRLTAEQKKDGMMRLFLISAFSVLFLCSCATRSFVRDEIRKVVDSRPSTVEIEKRLEVVEIEVDRALALANHVLWKIKEKVTVTEFIPYLAEREINFAFDSYGLDKEAETVLDEIGQMLRLNLEYKLTIEGHACKIGTERYNQDLGRRRAEEVERYLAEKFSVPLHRIFSLTFGESAPKISNATKAGRAANRRVVLQIWVPM